MPRMFTAGFGAFAAAAMCAATMVHAAPSLSPASSAELQKLLGVQIGKLAVEFSNHTPPRVPVSP